MEQRAVTRQKKAVGCLTWQAARQPKTAESGQTLLEFAFMLPVLMLLLLGIAEIGRAAFITITVNNAATAGAEYGSQNATTASDFPGMQNAALCDANGHIGLSACNTTGILTTGNITPTSGCACDTGGGTSCNTFVSCTDPSITGCTGQVAECVQVTTHADFTPLFNYPGLPTMYHANGNAVQRVRK